jgi:hypothetical protein
MLTDWITLTDRLANGNLQNAVGHGVPFIWCTRDDSWLHVDSLADLSPAVLSFELELASTRMLGRAIGKPPQPIQRAS